MKFKNFTIITLIFVIPMFVYMLLSKPDASLASKVNTGTKPQIIKFTSLMCLDCKKLGTVMKDIYPKYSDKIMLVEVQVQNNDDYTRKQIEKYNVTLVPTMIFIDSRGKKIAKIEGFVEKDKLDQMMKELN